jgi:hypothetical protein
MREKRVLPAVLRWQHGVALWLVAAGAALSGCKRASSPPAVECVLDYGGQSQTTVVRPTSEPYRVKALKIEDAFEFKAVYVAAPPALAALNFYAYYVSDRGPVIVEQTKYRPPFPRNSPSSNGNFTGAHHVYAPDGEELVYACSWRSP